MNKEERDEYIDKFRNGEISTIITTNLLSRGYDIDNIKLVINFDVPNYNVNDKVGPDFLNYMYRITRAGRFGDTGIALTLFDND
jgi:superfamily II DNA/RNA helicase